MSPTAPLMALQALEIGYRVALFPAFDLSVHPGDFVGVVGPNGAGKSTLLKTMCGVLRPIAGRVAHPAGRPRIAYVPQPGDLDRIFPLTATEVVALGLVPGLRLWERLGGSHTQRARQALAELGVEDTARRPFRDLSGGQRQRVLLARALVSNPELLVVDEPTAAMDIVAAARLHAVLHRLHVGGVAVVTVSHDLPATAALADHLIIMDRDRRRLIAGPTREVMRADVLGRIFGVPVSVVEHGGHWDVTPDVSGSDTADGPIASAPDA